MTQSKKPGAQTFDTRSGHVEQTPYGGRWVYNAPEVAEAPKKKFASGEEMMRALTDIAVSEGFESAALSMRLQTEWQMDSETAQALSAMVIDTAYWQLAKGNGFDVDRVTQFAQAAWLAPKEQTTALALRFKKVHDLVDHGTDAKHGYPLDKLGIKARMWEIWQQTGSLDDAKRAVQLLPEGQQHGAKLSLQIMAMS